MCTSRCRMGMPRDRGSREAAETMVATVVLVAWVAKKVLVMQAVAPMEKVTVALVAAAVTVAQG